MYQTSFRPVPLHQFIVVKPDPNGSSGYDVRNEKRQVVRKLPGRSGEQEKASAA